MSDFQYTRLEDGRKTRFTDLAAAINSKNPRAERWMFVSPHDDDACLGGGLWIAAAVQSGFEVEVLIVTDGRMGYCSIDQIARIIQTRRAETIESCGMLGVPPAHVQYIGYPDGGLYGLQGRRPAAPGENDIHRYVGLQNAMTHHLREFRPTAVFVPTSADLHPDHQITNRELMISLFHASGAIWPELGEPIAQVPRVFEMAVYCDFPEPPNLEVRASEAMFEKKLKSIAAFRSQLQIDQLVANVRAAGAYEYTREMKFRFYSADTYKPMFA
ncbi:MAG: PIG-L family deacetylase [Tepidisphaeraceae bacterium]|jgi:LmbE family N-acetylglucosaminyl deacetylase